jgi:peptide/nickel transport system ATP-binding protein
MTRDEDESMIRVRSLRKWFPVRTGLIYMMFSREEKYVKAVDCVDFDIHKGEIFGLVGESGSGKTTTGRLLLRAAEPTSGEIYFDGKDISEIKGKELKKLRKRMQMIFQDPYSSLNSRMKIYDIVSEPLKLHGVCGSGEEEKSKVTTTLELTRLAPPEKFINKYPHQLSGGERQRVSIARALVLEPDFLVADEPVSMLDVSLRSDILNLLLDLRDKYHFTCLYITHDLAVSRYVCDRIMVMYLGKPMEIGPAERVVRDPRHPYTKALIKAVFVPDPAARKSQVELESEIPSAIDPPRGCRFHPRCKYAEGRCASSEPELVEVEANHFVACHNIDKIDNALTN